MANDKVKIIVLIISFSYMGALFIGSSFPGKVGSENILSDLPSLLQNLLHIPAFGVLTLLWIKTLEVYHIQDRLAVMLAVGIAVLYGAGLELYQATVPGRFSSMSDIMLNIVGVLLSVLIYNIFKRQISVRAFKC